MADVVIVGAGPVGLWTAFQLLLRRPTWTVVLYERDEVYKRSHVLRLDHWSMLLYGRHKRSAHADARRKLYEAIAGKSLPGIALAPAGSIFIRTNELEAALRTQVLAMGARIAYQRIESPAEAEARHPECSRFIAADGARSPMRRALLGDEDTREVPLRRVVEVKYETRGPGQRLGVFSEQLSVNRKLQHMAFEYVGRPKDGVAPVTLRFFVNSELYEALGDASFKAPLSLDEARVPDALKRDIHSYMAQRAGAGAEAVCRASATLTKLTLSAYAAREFTVRTPAGCWFLVGDAAMGVPYFRALNSGFILGSRLAQILGTSNWPLSGKLNRQRAAYRLHQPLHVLTEFAIARSKDALLSGYDWARQVNLFSSSSVNEAEIAAEQFEHGLSVDCWRD